MAFTCRQNATLAGPERNRLAPHFAAQLLGAVVAEEEGSGATKRPVRRAVRSGG